MARGDEVLIRERLSCVLESVTPSPAPVAAVVRKGKLVRIRRRAGLGTAAVVAILAVALAMPGSQSRRRPLPSPPEITAPRGSRVVAVHLDRLGQQAVAGVIARGTVYWSNHSRDTWRIWLDQRANKVYANADGGQPGWIGDISASGELSDPMRGVGPNDPSMREWLIDYAVARPDVTNVRVVLNNGAVVNLRPVSAAGRHWVGLAIPRFGGLYVVTASAYAGTRELAHTTTYGGTVLSWLPPGQNGPARKNVLIGSGVVPRGFPYRWRASVQAGPWGYCLSLYAFQAGFDADCLTTAEAQVPGVKVSTKSYGAPYRWLIGTAEANVGYLRLALTHGAAVRIQAVSVDGLKFFAFAIVRGEQVVRWGAYDPAGRRIYGGLGLPPVRAAHPSWFAPLTVP